MEGGKQQAAKKVVRVSTSTSTPEFPNTTTPHQQYTLAELKKMKATELLVLLFQQGRVFNKRTRKQVSINAYLGDASNIPRDNWKNLKTKQTHFDKIIIWKKKTKTSSLRSYQNCHFIWMILLKEIMNRLSQWICCLRGGCHLDNHTSLYLLGIA